MRHRLCVGQWEFLWVLFVDMIDVVNGDPPRTLTRLMELADTKEKER